MTFLKRSVITLVVIAIMGGLLELGLRVFVPSFIEGGTRVALRVPQTSDVNVDLEGSLALNALRWRIADVTVTAEDVPLSDDIRAETTLYIESLPLIPVLGKLRDGTATFVIPAEQLDAVARLVSSGLAEWGAMRDDVLVGGGVLTDAHFDLPHSPPFEIAYEAPVELAIADGDIQVTSFDVSVDDGGPVGAFLAEAMSEARPVCIKNRLPKGAELTGIAVSPSGEVRLYTELSDRLLSNPSERFPGTCV